MEKSDVKLRECHEALARKYGDRILSKNLFVCSNATGNPVEQLYKGIEDALSHKDQLLEMAADALKAKDQLLVCYRLNKRPTEKLFKQLEQAQQTLLTLQQHGYGKE